MSRTKYAAELCALVVEDNYGELSSRIVTLLLRRGRLSIPSLVQHTHLTPRQLRHGLAVLIQQNLIFHCFDDDTQITFYDANQEAIYFLIRFGKIIDAIQSRYGNTARDIIRELLLLGSAKIGDLLDSVEARQHNSQTEINGHDRTNGLSNGKHNGQNGPSESSLRHRIDDVLFQLSQGGFIQLVVKGMFLSADDTYNDVEKDLLQQGYGGAIKGGTKQKEDLKGQIRERLQEIRLEREQALKRAPTETQLTGEAKRRKLTNGDHELNGYGNQNADSRLDRNLTIRVNYQKCMVALRSDRLISLARHDIGPTTSQVYGALLRLLEEKISRCQSIDDTEDQSEEPTITTMALVQTLRKSINVALGIGKDPNRELGTTQPAISKTKTSQLKRKKSLIEPEADGDGDASLDEYDHGEGDDGDVDENGNIMGIDQDSDSGEEDFSPIQAIKAPLRKPKVTFQTDPVFHEDRQNRISQTNAHLLLLAGHSKSFVRRCGGSDFGEWTVDFEDIVEYLKEVELDTFVVQKFGKQGSRIARILRQKGKLDEKQIQKFGLLKQKDIRTKLVEMQMGGSVDIQEVPRDNNRTISRTIFLWFFDTERVKTILLEKVYKTMSRSLQVLKTQKSEHNNVLTLAARTDIRGQEEEFLRGEQLTRWETIRETEERILVQIARLDELVALFRDF